MQNDETVLKVDDLRVYYATSEGDVKACDGVSFEVRSGEILGLVGESGSGKSTATSGVLRTVSSPGRIVSGRVILDGDDILQLADEAMRKLRWQKLALIPQGAMNSLNPTMTISAQIADVIETHEGRQPQQILQDRIYGLLRMVGLPARIYSMYPHELSGGMKQRACIAMSIALDPKVIVADEATSALDVVVQRVVAQTMLRIKNELNVSFIMIGHDMGLMAQVVDRLAVMYGGQLVEIAGVQDMFAAPAHPYSEILIDSVPTLTERKAMRITEGITHDPRNPPTGCIFRLRCPYAMDKCAESRPALTEVRPGQSVACHLWKKDENGNYVRASV
ncbi:MAG: ABC transporter ATP-binding protein [Pseudomonadota bacterium]